MTEKMKPSGIAWIGDVPESWNLLKLKYFSYLKGRIGWQGLTADEFIDEGPYLITGTDFENGRIQFDRSYHISEARYAQAPEIQLQIGDLLVTKDGTVGKMAYVDELPGKASLNSHLLLIRPLEGKYHNRFLFWLMSSSVFTGYTEYSQDGTIMASLSQEKIGNFLAYFPDLDEQCAIADVLDAQCAKIDRVIADIEKQIETLQKYKKSLITEAVTKGLNQSAPMKDSGIEWIGEIPSSWKVEPIKYRVDFFNGDRGENYPSKAEMLSEGVPFINAGHLLNDGLDMENMDYISEEKYKVMGGVKLRKGDILYCLRGSVGKNAILDIDRGTVASSLVALRSRSISAKFLYYSLNSHIDEVQRFLWDNGTAQPNLSAENLGKFKVCIPNRQEQDTIVDFLDEKCSAIDDIVESKTQALRTMQQHKKSLIYEYVTGKKRVTEVN